MGAGETEDPTPYPVAPVETEDPTPYPIAPVETDQPVAPETSAPEQPETDAPEQPDIDDDDSTGTYAPIRSRQLLRQEDNDAASLSAIIDSNTDETTTRSSIVI